MFFVILSGMMLTVFLVTSAFTLASKHLVLDEKAGQAQGLRSRRELPSRTFVPNRKNFTTIRLACRWKKLRYPAWRQPSC